jgi:hypothetical protein
MSMAIVTFITGCGLPMLLVGSIFFINMLKALNTAYVDKHLFKAAAFTRTWLPKLYESVKLQVAQIWRHKGNVLGTVGMDGLTTQPGEKVNLLTEAVLDKVLFVDCQEIGKIHANG